MPCYQVQSVSVEFHVAHRDLLDKAIKALGWNAHVNGTDYTICTDLTSRNLLLNLATGKATVYDGQVGVNKLNALKRAYSQEAIKLAAKLGGWQVKPTSSNQGNLVRSCL